MHHQFNIQQLYVLPTLYLYDMIWYIYLAAIGLTPGGNGTAHIYTQQYTEYKERNIHNNHKIEHA